MNQDIRKEWTRRLRSGEYKQGKQFLCRVLDDGSKQYCCWGVLCDMAVEANVIDAELVDGTISYDIAAANSIYDNRGRSWTRRMPSSAVLRWARIPHMNDGPDSIFPVEDYQHLASMNDRGVPFREIADRIDVIGGGS
jgi:hypothetical protein